MFECATQARCLAGEHLQRQVANPNQGGLHRAWHHDAERPRAPKRVSGSRSELPAGPPQLVLLPDRRGLADEVDLQARDGIEEPVGERGSADVQATMRAMDKDQVGDAPLANDFLQPASQVRGLSSDDLRAQVRGVIDVGLQILLPVA